MNIQPSFETNAQLAKTRQPPMGSLYYPAMTTQSLMALACLLTPGARPVMAQTSSSHGDWHLIRALRVGCPDVPPRCVVYCLTCLCLLGYILFPVPPGAGNAGTIKACSVLGDIYTQRGTRQRSAKNNQDTLSFDNQYWRMEGYPPAAVWHCGERERSGPRRPNS